MKFIRSRVGAVVAGATVLGLLTAGGAAAHGFGGSIGGEDVRNGSLYSQDIAAGQVKTSELKNGGVAKVDLSQEVIDLIAASTKGDKGDTGEQGTKGDTGQVGPTGPTGAKGDTGETGETGAAGADGKDGVTGYEVVGRGSDESNDGSAETLCKSADQAANEKVAQSGGYKVLSGDVVVTGSFPSSVERVGPNTPEDPSGLWAAKGWTVTWTGEGTVKPYVICANVG